MKVLVIRVSKAKVKVESNPASSIDNGIVVFAGFSKDDGDSELTAMADKISNLRIFENKDGKMWYSVRDKNYDILCIPNFTLCANVYKGRRPSFEDVMPPSEAKDMFDKFIVVMRSKGIIVQTGLFGEHMNIDLTMDGPVNIVLEYRSGYPRRYPRESASKE